MASIPPQKSRPRVLIIRLRVTESELELRREEVRSRMQKSPPCQRSATTREDPQMNLMVIGKSTLRCVDGCAGGIGDPWRLETQSASFVADQGFCHAGIFRRQVGFLLYYEVSDDQTKPAGTHPQPQSASQETAVLRVPGKSLHIDVEIAVACELADIVDEVIIGGKMVALEQGG